MGWEYSPTPVTYDCRLKEHSTAALGIWHRACKHAADRHEPHSPPKLLSWRSASGRTPDVWQLVRLLANRTVSILGDSHALDVWCALTCAVIHESNSTLIHEVQTQKTHCNTTLSPSCHSKTQMILVTRLQKSTSLSRRAVVIRDAWLEARWIVPPCAFGHGGCGTGVYCGTFQRGVQCSLGCGASLVPAPDPAKPMVVVYSPCPSYMGSKLMACASLPRFAALHSFRGLPNPPLRAECQQQDLTPSHHGYSRLAFRNVVESYRRALRAAAEALHRLGAGAGGLSVGMLMQVGSTHPFRMHV
jgi:hypothetical protein